jgi:hypothetical protein
MRSMIASALCFGAFFSIPAQALEPPKGSVILEVRGNITETNAPGAARFDLAMLKALGTVTVTTGTPWTDKATQYEGVEGAAILKAVGAKGATLAARAINDYEIEVPVEDLMQKGVFFAYSADGKRLTTRDKGPLWLLYPFDDRPELKVETNYSRSIWQVKVIEVK